MNESNMTGLNYGILDYWFLDFIHRLVFQTAHIPETRYFPPSSEKVEWHLFSLDC